MASSRDLDIWCVLGQQRAVRGPQDTQEASFTFYELNTYRLRLHAQRPVRETGSLSRFTPASFDEFVGFEAALGLLDAKPEGGTIKMRLVGETDETADIPHNATTTQLQTALNALPTVDVEVTQGNDTNIYIIRPVDSDAEFTFEVHENALTPLCNARVRSATDGQGKYTMLKLHKAYFAFTNQWVTPTPPEASVQITRTGDVTRNCIQQLTIPSGAVGQIELSHGGFKTSLIAVTGISESIIASALNALFTDGTTNPRFRVFAAGDGAFQIECIGAIAKVAVPQLGIDHFGQTPEDTPEADFALTQLPLELSVAGKTKVPVVFELTALDASNNEHTLLQKDCNVINKLIDRSTSSLIATVATRTETVYVYPSETDPAVVAKIGRRFLLNVETDDAIIQHDFGTYQVGVLVLRKTASGPDKWEGVSDASYAWEAINSTQIQIYFGYEVPATPAVGSLEVWIFTLDAVPVVNDHEHDDDEINCTGDEAGKKLNEVIAELRASLPSDWPSIPANKITGKLTPDQIDLAALAVALKTTPEFLNTLRDLASDAGLLDVIAAGLGGRPSFLDVLKALITNADLLAVLAPGLLADSTFSAGVRSMLTSAPAPAGTIILPDVEELFFGSLPEGVTARQALVDPSLLGTNERTGLLPAVHDAVVANTTGPLPKPSQANSLFTIGTFTVVAATDVITCNTHGLTDGMRVRVGSSDTLPAGLSAGIYYVRDATTNTLKLAVLEGGSAVDVTDTGTGTHTLYWVRGVVRNSGTASLRVPGGLGHRSTYLLPNALAATDGRVWYEVVQPDATKNSFYPYDAETELFLIAINDPQLPDGGVLTLQWDLEPAVFRSSLFVQGMMLVHVGAFTAESNPTPTTSDNLKGVTWNSAPMLRQRVVISSIAVTHRFGIRISRTGSSFSAETLAFGQWSAAGAVPSATTFALRGKFGELDTQDTTDPRGRVFLSMRNGTGAIT